MGYTHYIRPSEPFTEDEWARFTALVLKIFEATGVEVAGWDGTGAPEISDERVSFNGKAPFDYETCTVERAAVGFSFCKTAVMPYDEVVRAVYLAADDCLSNGVGLSSDGGDPASSPDWQAARDLYWRVVS